MAGHPRNQGLVQTAVRIASRCDWYIDVEAARIVGIDRVAVRVRVSIPSKRIVVVYILHRRVGRREVTVRTRIESLIGVCPCHSESVR